ncbi:MAG TPA: hypothetical protein VGF45_19295, partial [Polyangia bacterium]
AAAAVLGATTWLVAPRMVERPHVLSFGFEVVLLAILLIASERRRWLALGPPVVALWANLHAGAFLGPVMIGAAAAGAWIDERRHPRMGGDRSALWVALFTTALICAGALMATPVGAGIYRYLGFHVDIHAVHPVDEFRAPDLDSDLGFFVGLTALVTALFVWPRRVPTPWRERLPVLVVGALACGYVRFGPDFALIAAPVVAARLTALSRVIPVQGLTWPRLSQHLVRVVLGCATVVAVALGIRATTRFDEHDSDVHRGLAADLFPEAALRFIEANGLGAHMYNDFEIGGYLAWRWFPQRRIFVDPRLPAYPAEFHALLGRGDLSRAEWDAGLRGHGVESALITHAGINPRAAWWALETWALVYRQDDARVFVRRLPRWERVIAAHEIPATFRFDARTGTATLPLDHPPALSPVPSCEWNLRLGDLLFDLDDGDDRRALATYQRALAAPHGCLAADRRWAALTWTGATFLRHRRWAEALARLDEALAAPPVGIARDDQIAVAANRALALEGLQRLQEAAIAWTDIAHKTADDDLRQKATARAARLRLRPAGDVQ